MIQNRLVHLPNWRELFIYTHIVSFSLEIGPPSISFPQQRVIWIFGGYTQLRQKILLFRHHSLKLVFQTQSPECLENILSYSEVTFKSLVSAINRQQCILMPSRQQF